MVSNNTTRSFLFKPTISTEENTITAVSKHKNTDAIRLLGITSLIINDTISDNNTTLSTGYNTDRAYFDNEKYE